MRLRDSLARRAYKVSTEVDSGSHHILFPAELLRILHPPGAVGTEGPMLGAHPAEMCSPSQEARI